MLESARAGEKILRGIAVSAGVCRGKILVLDQPLPDAFSKEPVPDEEAPNELRRLEQALVETRHQILEVQHQVSAGLS